jgi:hypothetical protein
MPHCVSGCRMSPPPVPGQDEEPARALPADCPARGKNWSAPLAAHAGRLSALRTHWTNMAWSSQLRAQAAACPAPHAASTLREAQGGLFFFSFFFSLLPFFVHVCEQRSSSRQKMHLARKQASRSWTIRQTLVLHSSDCDGDKQWHQTHPARWTLHMQSSNDRDRLATILFNTSHSEIENLHGL